jgi:cell division protein FtsL
VLFNAGPWRVVVLWVLVLISAIAVGLVSHLSRQQYAQLMILEREASQLDEDYGKYLLEQSAWGSLQRVETVAAQQLNMHSPRSSEILIVKSH